MKNFIFFANPTSSLRVSFLFLLVKLTNVLQIVAQAPQFASPHYLYSNSFSSYGAASGRDVVFEDNSCSANVHMIGNRQNGGMGWSDIVGEVAKYSPNTGLSTYYAPPVPSGMVACTNDLENSIHGISVNANGYISYYGGVGDCFSYYNAGVPYVNTYIFTGTYIPPTIKSILSSPTNDTYICGTFLDSALFGNNINLYLSGTNGFLAKYSGGTVLWAISLPNFTPTQLMNLSNGTFVMMGTFSGTASINSYTISTNSGGNMFWAKLLPNGTCTALTQISSGGASPKALRMTSNGDMYVTGIHSNGAIIAGSTLTGTGAFTAKYDTMGIAQSAIHIGPTNVTSYNDMDIDANGNTFFITNTTAAKYSITNVALWNVNVTIYNSSLNGTYSIPLLQGIGVDANGNVGIAGKYSPTEGLAIGNTGWVSGNINYQGPDPVGFYSLALDALPSLSSPSQTICSGGAATLTFNAGAGTSAYTWQQSTNGGASWYSVSGTTSTTTSTVVTLTATRLFRVIYNSTTCGTQTTPVFTLNVVPDPTVTVTASSNNFCAGGNTTLTATLNGGVGTGIYQWQRYVGTTWSSISGATAANYTTPALTANTNYRVISSQTGAGCVTTGANTINVIVKPLPNIYTNPAAPTICTGGSQTITAYNGASYSWSPATGLNTTTGSPVVASPTSSTTYSLIGVGTNGCSKTISVPVVVNADPTISVTGDSVVCSGGTVTLTSTGTGGAGTCTRQWQKSSNGTSWSNIAGATGITYTTTAITALTYYRVTFTCSGGGCSPAAVSNSHKIKLFDNTLTAFNNVTAVCVGGSVKLTAPTMNLNSICSWTWESSTNNSTWTTIAGANTYIYYPPTTAAAATYYRVTANCTGATCTNTPTPSLLITVNADPSVSILGINSICTGSNTTLTANPLGGVGVAAYQWQENNAGVFANIAGATTTSLVTPVLTAAKTYRVQYSANGAGCGTATSANYTVSIKPLPSIYTSPASATICVGGAQSFTAYNGTSYSWSPATGLSAAVGSPIVASPTSSTTYSLTGVGTNGCSKTISVPVTVNPDPSISILGPSSVPSGTSATLTATNAGGAGTCTRQWQSSTNGTSWSNISGATGATYTTPAITGTKYFRATYTCSAAGCSPAAVSNVKSIVGIQPPTRLAEQSYEMTLFPNPASVNLTINVSTIAEEEITFLISDMLGKTLSIWEGKALDGIYEQEISIENLSQGIYFLSAKVGENTITQKFVKE